MKDDWVGDEGDFLKLGLLRYLCRVPGPHLPLGVVWYYRNSAHPGNAHQPPARPINARYRRLAPELFDYLTTLHADGRRRLQTIIEEGILPSETAHYITPLHLPGNHRNAEHRAAWHRGAHSAVSHCETVFLDPDNGIQPGRDTKKDHSTTRLAHALWREIEGHWRSGKSLIIFQHAPRMKNAEEHYRDGLVRRLRPTTRVATFRRGPRWLYVVPQEQHASAIMESLRYFRDAWKDFLTPSQGGAL